MSVSLPGAWRARWGMRLSLMLGCERPALRHALAWREREPDHARAWSSVAYLQARLGDLGSARAALEGCVQRFPDDAQAWFNLAYVCEAQGELARAEQAFGLAVNLSPKLDRAWYGLGLCLIRQQRLEEAVAALRKAAELQPMSPFAWYQLARVHADRAEWALAEGIVEHLQGFEPQVAARLRLELCSLPRDVLGEEPYGAN